MAELFDLELHDAVNDKTQADSDDDDTIEVEEVNLITSSPCFLYLSLLTIASTAFCKDLSSGRQVT